MTVGVSEALKDQYRTAFGAALTRSLKTQRAQWYWIDLSTLVDGLAGPVSTILNSRRCEYVYAPDDNRFRGVIDPGTLRQWCLKRRNELVVAIDRFAPTSADEQADQALMHRFMADIWAVTEQLLAIEREGWEAARAT
jgi:hypothetical protein